MCSYCGSWCGRSIGWLKRGLASSPSENPITKKLKWSWLWLAITSLWLCDKRKHVYRKYLPSDGQLFSLHCMFWFSCVGLFLMPFRKHSLEIQHVKSRDSVCLGCSCLGSSDLTAVAFGIRLVTVDCYICLHYLLSFSDTFSFLCASLFTNSLCSACLSVEISHCSSLWW